MLPHSATRFTALEARRIARRNRVVEEGTFRQIRQQCNQRIRQAAHKEPPEYEASFTVPPIVFGRPVYNHPGMCRRLIDSLRADGFRVRHPAESYWDLTINFAPPPRPKSKRRKKPSRRRPPSSFNNLSRIRRQLDVNRAFGHD